MTTIQNALDPGVDAFRQAEARFLESTRHTNEFLATLGHEMRNPLSALRTALDLWSMELLDAVQLAEIRQLMQRQVQQLRRLSDDVLDVARIAQGKFELHPQQISLQQLISDACEEVRPVIDEREQALTVGLPSAAVMVNGDASRLLQVFANLLQNASKFTDRNGRLEIALDAENGLAVVRVRDNGRGIPANRLTTIFEPFTQLGKSRESNDGLGIGLRLVKTIVELHGGAVVAHSDGPGRGSEFTVQLPLLSPNINSERSSQQLSQPDSAAPRRLRRSIAS